MEGYTRCGRGLHVSGDELIVSEIHETIVKVCLTLGHEGFGDGGVAESQHTSRVAGVLEARQSRQTYGGEVSSRVANRPAASLALSDPQVTTGVPLVFFVFTVSPDRKSHA